MPPSEISSIINEFESPYDHITCNGKMTLLLHGFQFNKEEFESECQLTYANTRKINSNTQRNFNDDQWKNPRRENQKFDLYLLASFIKLLKKKASFIKKKKKSNFIVYVYVYSHSKLKKFVVKKHIKLRSHLKLKLIYSLRKNNT